MVEEECYQLEDLGSRRGEKARTRKKGEKIRDSKGKRVEQLRGKRRG